MPNVVAHAACTCGAQERDDDQAEHLVADSSRLPLIRCIYTSTAVLHLHLHASTQYPPALNALIPALKNNLIFSTFSLSVNK